MREAYIVGAGQTPFGSFPDRSYRDLFSAAYTAAVESIPEPVAPDRIDEVFVGTLGVGGRQIGLAGPAVATHAGIGDAPTTRVENACASGGSALRSAVEAVRGGRADLAVAGGVEVMTDVSDDVRRWWLGVSGETEWERLTGATFAGVYAQMASAYLDTYDVDREVLSAVTVKNHDNGAKNPAAQLGFSCTLEDAETAPMVADPLTLYHCCPTSDGAAVALVASEDLAGSLRDDPVRVAGVGAGTDSVGVYDRATLTGIPAAATAADRAYEDAGIEARDVDVAEVHDCFAIAELFAYEDLGFCERGEAATLIEEDVTALSGDRPVNPSGGLKAKGHPIGATGTGQAVEAFKQLTGDAGDRQVHAADRAVLHNVGGSGGAAVVHVLECGP
ncbi:MAG: thiolase domain-containing protein [Halobacteriaceae archaeon]